jgi:protein PsiE
VSEQFEGHDGGAKEKYVALKFFHLIERLLLVIVVLMTLGGVGFEVLAVYYSETIALADILLMFLYLEVIGMAAVFYSDRRSFFVYPIFIAITALARLIVLQGKEMAPESILYEAISILVLTGAAVIITRLNQTLKNE